MADDARKLNPWLFVPVLYFMQAMPVTIVQEVATVFYKDLGVANEPILRWTSLISLPWSMQLLFGPLVDLNGTKRAWILGGQFLITIGLVATAWLLAIPQFFVATLLILGVTAITSAFCNIATDGFYILSLAKEQQAKFVGVQTTCYRLGRLFCTGILVLLVGILTSCPALSLPAPAGGSFLVGELQQTRPVGNLNLRPSNGRLVSGPENTPVQGTPVGASPGDPLTYLDLPAGTFGLEVAADRTVSARTMGGTRPVGMLAVSVNGAAALGTVSPASTSARYTPRAAWIAILTAAAGLYFFGFLLNRTTVPRPPEDRPAEGGDRSEASRNIGRTLLLVAAGVGGYFTLNAAVRLIAQVLSPMVGPGWELPDPNLVLGMNLGLGPAGTEIAQLTVAGSVATAATWLGRRSIVGTPMGETFASFVRQPGFAAIFGFILFYRLGEAMVSKMSPLFLKDALANGGLAVDNQSLGLIKGFAGVVGIVAGGLLGGLVVSRIGLRRAFFPLALAMHIPNLLYLWASVQRPPNSLLFVIEFVDQFGYGFGFAAYMVYIMWVAQRGRFKTAHYAIGTGLGALCIALAGITGGVLQANFGYTGFFIAVMLLSLPGLLMLRLIPHDA